MPIPVSAIPGCAGCPMRDKFPMNAFVPPKRGTDPLCVIGEAPGGDEATYGEPFVGAAGAMLNGWFSRIGIPRNKLWMTNVLSCRPHRNWFPTDTKARTYMSLDAAHATIAHCREAHLLPFLREHEWEKIYLIGGKALYYMANRSPMRYWGGTPLAIPELGSTAPIAVATHHPAGLMRDPKMLPFVYSDLQRPLVVPAEDYHLHAGVDALNDYFGRPFAIDCETDIPEHSTDQKTISMFSLSNRANHAIQVDATPDVMKRVGELIAQATEIVGQNLIDFDLPVFESHHICYNKNPDECTIWDTMLMHHIIWPSLSGVHKLGDLARQYTYKAAWKKWDEDEVTGEKLSAAEANEALYAARDADATAQAYVKLRKELELVPSLRRTYLEISVPMARICRLMTDIGILTDPAAAKEMAATAEQKIAEAEQILPPHMRPQQVTVMRQRKLPPGTLSPIVIGKSGKPLKRREIKVEKYESVEWTSAPWKSHPQTSSFLYEELGLKEMRDAEGKLTTGKKALAILAYQSGRPEVKAITDARVWAHRKKQCEKLYSDTDPEQNVAKRIHASFNVHGTSSGRLSSTGGDEKIQLQNITEDMRVIFVPSQPGWVLFSCDFSQMEARIAAFLANDVDRLARFDQPGYSEYKHAASIFLGIPAEEVAKDKSPDSPYHKAKTIVLGTDRALGAKKISITNDIPLGEVREMQEQWKSAIPATMVWQQRVGDRAKRQGYLFNSFGRRGRFYGGKEYTEGISFGPQSDGADVIFRGMIGLLYERIDWPREWALRVNEIVEPLPEPARVLLQVHDEIVGECPEEMVGEVQRVVERVLSQPRPELPGLKLPVNFAYGPNWLKMEDC